MYTIKQTSKLTGIPETSLRAWERRYRVVSPQRSEAGYRIYDEESVAALCTMRRLVDAGWSPVEAARAVRTGAVPPSPPPVPDLSASAVGDDGPPDATDYMSAFLAAAAAMDAPGVEQTLDRAFGLGSFEHVVDSWLFPTLVALGEGWARGQIDVAAEHAASHAVLRRLSAAFEAAGTRSRGPLVVVGLPPGSHHELGALAFATALKRRGLNVLYLGANVPENSWEAAVTTHSAEGAVLAVVTATDRAPAIATAARLKATHPGLLVASGGAFGPHLTDGVHTLAPTIGSAAEELDMLLHDETG